MTSEDPKRPALPTPPAHPAHPALGPTAPVYLDYNATTPVDPRVAEALQEAVTGTFGNPSSAHAFGGPAHEALDAARAQVAALIGARADELVFTGSGSESDALAIRGAVLAALASEPARWDGERPQVVTQATEHPAVLAACAYLARWHGVEVTILPVDASGRLDPADLATALTPRTVLVAVMHANNETGTVQPIAELAAVAHKAGALFHTDAAQTVAKLDVDVAALGVDLLTIVGHKMYAPKGIGALWVRPGVRLEPLVGGGSQEGGLRAGTENLPHIVALGRAATIAAADLAAGEPGRLSALRDRLHHALDAALPGRVVLNGDAPARLPHTLNVSIAGVDSRGLLAEAVGVAASTGSACHAGETTPSPVLTAMGLDADRALGALRLSLGRWSTADDVDRAAALIADAARGGQRSAG